MLASLPFLPDQASTIAGEVDALFIFLVAVSAFFSLLIAGLIVVFAVRYRRRSEDELPKPIHGSLKLELTWTLIPFALAMVIFVWAARVYLRISRPPDNALQVFVVGKQWMWKIQHMEGQREINELHAPAGRPVKLTMTSEDVIHSFFIPAFRVKTDVLPGRYTTLWFEATKPGIYHLFCAEYCGTEHSRMIGRIVVMEPGDFQVWLSGEGESPPPEPRPQPMERAGAEIFQRLGCPSCHDAETTPLGPSLVRLYGKRVQLESGHSVRADENYIRESILDPRAKIVAGFEPLMPTFQGQIGEEQVLQLLQYVRSLDGTAERAESGTR